jgi:signal transduction histidine kinase/CheY-like chemotaxis protein
MFQNIQNRLILLITAVSILFITGLFMLRFSEIEKLNAVIERWRIEKNFHLGKSISLMGKGLESYCDDVSSWDEMVSFIQKPDNKWAKENIAKSAHFFNIPLIWIYNNNIKKIYTLNKKQIATLDTLPLPANVIQSLCKKNLFSHFFIKTSSGLLEVRGAPVQPTNDLMRITAPKGYLFTAFIWNNEYLYDLGELTSSRIEIQNYTSNHIQQSTKDNGLLTNNSTRTLYGWNEKPVATIVSTSTLPVPYSFLQTFDTQFYYQLLFVVAVISLLSFLLFRYVRKPLQTISESLSEYNTEGLIKLSKKTDEFGAVAKLITNFFIQQTKLKIEIKERVEAQLKYLRLNNELEDRINERTKQLEELNKALIIEIEERKMLLDELIRAKEKAEESDMLKSAFLANMSHEIRTPMNAVLGFTSLLKNDNLLVEKRNQYIDIIESSGTQLLALINDIIDISKIEAGQIRIVEAHCNINKILENIYEFFKNEIQRQSKPVELILQIPQEKLTEFILIDEVRFKQILINLISNAIKFTSHGSIEFGYTHNENKICFFVKDTGIGISPEKHQLIFERFRQADETTVKKYGGTGLGLAISRNLVELMGGKIWLESEEEKGTCFFFEIPKKIAESLQNKEPEYNQQTEFTNNSVIYIGNHEASFQLFKRTISKTGIRIFKVGSAIQTINIYNTPEKNDLIFIDSMIAEPDVLKLCKELKRASVQIPIVLIMDSTATDKSKERFKKAGISDYIYKPIQYSSILSLFNKWLVLTEKVKNK